MDEQPVVLVIGDFSEERIDLPGLCARFGWKMKKIRSLDSDAFCDWSKAVAGLIDSSIDGGAELRRACRKYSEVLWIACRRYSAGGDCLGAFHVVHRPFQASEVLQSLGFVDSTLAQVQRLQMHRRRWNAVA